MELEDKKQCGKQMNSKMELEDTSTMYVKAKTNRGMNGQNTQTS